MGFTGIQRGCDDKRAFRLQYADLHPVLSDADALLVCSDTEVNAELLSSASELKVVARSGARLDNVDIDEATRRGIFVIHVPEANVAAVVEYTFLLMLEMARHKSRHEKGIRCGDGDYGFQLMWKTLGVIGFRRQGREIAYRAQAFGMHVLAYEQGIVTSQAKNLVEQRDYPALIACRVSWNNGQRTVAGALFGNGEARLVAYDEFAIDAQPDGYVLILENEDKPGVIGKVGTRLSQASININQWRYGRDFIYGRGVSFINPDHRVPAAILAELEQEPEIRQARLVRL